MTNVTKNRFAHTLRFHALLTACLISRSALAQDATKDRPASEPAPTVPPPAGPPTTAAPTTPPDTPPAETLSIGPVERLPPSAYPSPRVRGLYGGSLWLVPDLHGLQWPYYPKTGIGVSGSGWVDTGYRTFDAGEATAGSPGLGTSEAKGKQFVQESRFVLRVTPTWTRGDWFVQAQAELVAARLDVSVQKLQFTGDDAWVRFGIWNKFDVLFGRFLAWEVYHYGMGLDLFTLERTGATGDPNNSAPPIYGVTQMYPRQDVLGQGAVHYYPTDWLRFEVGFQYGGGTTGANTVGVRPVGIADFGWLKLKAGAEFIEQNGQSDVQLARQQFQGAGGSIQFVLDPYVEFGFNGAYASKDTVDSMGRVDAANTNHQYTVGGFANARVVENLLVGAGLNYSFLEDTRFESDVNRNDNFDQWQMFGAVQYLLFKQLFLKAVVAYALADLNPTPQISPLYKNEMTSGRLRVMYLF